MEKNLKHIKNLSKDLSFSQPAPARKRQSSEEEFFLFLYKFLFIIIIGLFSARILTLIYNSQIFKQASSVVLAIIKRAGGM